MMFRVMFFNDPFCTLFSTILQQFAPPHRPITTANCLEKIPIFLFLHNSISIVITSLNKMTIGNLSPYSIMSSKGSKSCDAHFILKNTDTCETSSEKKVFFCFWNRNKKKLNSLTREKGENKKFVLFCFWCSVWA